MQNLNDIRSAFLRYFESGNGKANHEIVASSPVVPQNDPTLLFTNAGMVQFKNVFIGDETRPYQRAVSSQKCIRAGGKHNDLDNVGYTARHHTFFEMLGNFSFGDYFKEDAIFYAWDLLTREFALSADKLLVTVYAEDEEAAVLWKKITGFDDRRIIKIATSDNFWSMGDTGPCGPCSEIFYDHGDRIPGGPPGSPDEDGDRFIEIWNLVFMQFDQQAGGKRMALPKPSIDTGMGLERIAAVLQGVHDNYDIDLFKTLIAASENALHVKAKGGARASHRVIADHLRSISFLLADGVTPSNEGRGYVLRRIMRRAMRHAHLLGAKEPVVHTLVPTLIGEMGEAYPELVRAKALIENNVLQEEERFLRTLGRGMGLLDEATVTLGKGDQLPGDVAFKLYDTYGFPLDLTEDALRAKEITVDKAGFDAAMATQKASGRANWKGSGDAGDLALWKDAIEDTHAPTVFLGYKQEEAKAELQVVVNEGNNASYAEVGSNVDLVFNQTPFYAESGGQIGDAGIIKFETDAVVEISNTTKLTSGHFVHNGKVISGKIKVKENATLSVDHTRRCAIRANHSATHLLHAALHRHLGDHVAQKGSFVGPDYLRFDFTHSGPLSAEDLASIEDEVNAIVRQNADAETRETSPEDAIKAGATALFGEKYGNTVRVLSLGQDINDANRPYSIELCGGTHVGRTGDIALIKITGQSSVAAGVRRIEAVTGAKALEYVRTEEKALQEAAKLLKSLPEDLPKRLKQLLDERRKLEREVSKLRKQVAMGGNAASGKDAENINGTGFIGRVVNNVPPRDLRALVDESKEKLGSGVVVFAANNDGKAALAVGVSQDLIDRISAVDLVRAGSVALGGKGGGGRADFAQAGGPDGASAQNAIEAIKQSLAG
ncbi:MAG: alanine--tRNA ligase [Robiginitomaculum sp.]|nr:MAG: alanine--tRNA ligase [Robiginitomaculum sp.]